MQETGAQKSFNTALYRRRINEKNRVGLNTNEFLEAPTWVPILWSLNTINNVYFACIAAQTLKTQSQRSLI